MKNVQWITKGIVVKVKDKSMGQFYKKKGVVRQILGDFLAEVQIISKSNPAII